MADPLSPPDREQTTPTRLTREQRRELFRLNRVQALTALREQRRALRGGPQVADHLDDAGRWTA